MAYSERIALYRVYDSEGTLLYIGVSNNFGRRWKEHVRQRQWWNECKRMTVDWHDTRGRSARR